MFFKWLLFLSDVKLAFSVDASLTKASSTELSIQVRNLWKRRLSDRCICQRIFQCLQVKFCKYVKSFIWRNLGQARLTETKEAGQSIFLANSSDTNARWVKGKETEYIWKRYNQRKRKRTRKRKQRRRQMTRRLILATCRWRAVPRRSSAWTNAEQPGTEQTHYHPDNRK